MQPADQSITVVEVVPPPTRETGVPDILISSLGIVAVVLLAALVVGVVAGAILIGVKRLFPANHFNGQSENETALNLSDPSPR